MMMRDVSVVTTRLVQELAATIAYLGTVNKPQFIEALP
jgi:hypothetical protein